MKNTAIKDLRADDSLLSQDPRWQVAARIVASAPFAKSERLKAMLLYVVEESIRGNAHEISEQRIGHAVFGKGPDYSPAEDSSVRANARLLRLRLHEYYDLYGRNERLVLSLPKGSYVPSFDAIPEASPAAEVAVPVASPAHPAAGVAPLPEQHPPAARSGFPSRLLALAIVVSVGVGILIARLWFADSAGGESLAAVPQWPLSEIGDSGGQRFEVVVSDTNYGLFSILGGRSLTLDEYLHDSYPRNLRQPSESPAQGRLIDHLSRTSYVSFADTRMSNRFIEAFGSRRGQMHLRTARDFKTRDLADTNAIFIGSPSSNPWVQLFHDDLNFVEQKPLGGSAVFVNRNPRAGEQPVYAGIPKTGSSGVDYATIALLPRNSQHGKVLILQGAQQEGTEAAGLLLTTEQGRRNLRKSLGLSETGEIRAGTVFFEALIRSRAIGGSTAQTEIVATRRIPGSSP